MIWQSTFVYAYSDTKFCWTVPHIYFLFIFPFPSSLGFSQLMSASTYGRQMPVCLLIPLVIKEASQEEVWIKLHIRGEIDCWEGFKLLSHCYVIIYKLPFLLQGKCEGVWCVQLITSNSVKHLPVALYTGWIK